MKVIILRQHKEKTERNGSRFTTVRLSCPDNYLFALAIDVFVSHKGGFLLSFRSRDRMYLFLGKPELGSSQADSDAAPHARRPTAQWRPAPHPQKLPRPMWKSVPRGSLLNHWRIPHDDSEPFSKLAGRKLGFTSMVVWGGMCSFKGYFITTQLS